MKILVIQTAFIGDVVLATALVEQLHRNFPAAEIDFMLRKGNEGLLNNHPFLRKVWIWNKKVGKYKNLISLILDIRREQYDCVFNCQRFLASGLITILSGARYTVGFDKNPLSFLFSSRVKHRIGPGDSRFGLPYVHEVDRSLDLTLQPPLQGRGGAEICPPSPLERGLGGEVVPRLYPSQTDYQLAAALTGGGPYITCSPASVWFTKQWPADKWIELLQLLPQDIPVYLLGGPGDKDFCTRIKQGTGRANVQVVAGKLPYLASAALMAGARMNYVNDSAPLHFATSVNAPVTAIFCSTVPDFGFTPLSDETHIWQVDKPLECRPCGLHGKSDCPQKHFRCAYDIKIQNYL